MTFTNKQPSVDLHYEICGYMNDTYARKNKDYGNSFSRTYEDLGIISCVTRISDKYNRLVNLAQKPDSEREVAEETVVDTLLDMANYCIMTVMEIVKERN